MSFDQASISLSPVSEDGAMSDGDMVAPLPRQRKMSAPLTGGRKSSLRRESMNMMMAAFQLRLQRTGYGVKNHVEKKVYSRVLVLSDDGATLEFVKTKAERRRSMFKGKGKDAKITDSIELVKVREIRAGITGQGSGFHSSAQTCPESCFMIVPWEGMGGGAVEVIYAQATSAAERDELVSGIRELVQVLCIGLHCAHTLLYTVLVLLYSYYCTHTTVLLLLYSYYCTHTVLILYSHCTHTVLILYSYCTHTVLTLYSYCTHTVLTLYSHCTHTVLTLYSYCTHTTLLILLYSYYCTHTTLLVLLYSILCSYCTLLLVQTAMKSRSDAIMSSGVVNKQVALGTPPPAPTPLRDAHGNGGGGRAAGVGVGGGDLRLEGATILDLAELAEEYTCEVEMKDDEEAGATKVLASEKHIRQILEAGKMQREKYQMMVVQV
jgi:hypothetical protein